MKNVTVKICGLMHQKDVEACISLGVDLIGFVTEYPVPVPWNLTQSEASGLLKLTRSHCGSCIVTGGAPDKIISLATALRPSMVQLHYRETLADTIIIANELQKMNIGVIKTIPPSDEERIYEFGTSELPQIVTELCKTNISAILADSRTPKNASLNATGLNYHFCSEIISLSTKPVFIAGGITADNLPEIIAQTGADSIDVMTGVESSPGRKDFALIAKLMKIAKENCGGV